MEVCSVEKIDRDEVNLIKDDKNVSQPSSSKKGYQSHLWSGRVPSQCSCIVLYNRLEDEAIVPWNGEEIMHCDPLARGPLGTIQDAKQSGKVFCPEA